MTTLGIKPIASTVSRVLFLPQGSQFCKLKSCLHFFPLFLLGKFLEYFVRISQSISGASVIAKNVARSSGMVKTLVTIIWSFWLGRISAIPAEAILCCRFDSICSDRTVNKLEPVAAIMIPCALFNSILTCCCRCTGGSLMVRKVNG